jgi:pseudouridine-5'-phosphate glycosidase
VGIPVVATGGIGGVHRVVEGEASRWAGDVSADLPELARTPVCVVCAGPKAILDLSATAELLETLGVPIVGYRTGELPAFYCDSSGIALEHRVDSAAEAARMLHAVRELGRGMLLAVAPPEPLAVALVEGAIKEALREARTKGIHGKALTPFLLAAVARATGGEALKANVALLEKNAQVAGEVAAAYPKCG